MIQLIGAQVFGLKTLGFLRKCTNLELPLSLKSLKYIATYAVDIAPNSIILTVQ